jgi:hypothetical protein
MRERHMLSRNSKTVLHGTDIYCRPASATARRLVKDGVRLAGAPTPAKRDLSDEDRQREPL